MHKWKFRIWADEAESRITRAETTAMTRIGIKKRP
jgi:hypothetical protein